jgi:uncharacterized protein YdaU (DUF1376 family)
MTPAEEGAYLRLLCYCWESGDCSIPDDDNTLAKLSRLGKGWFKGSSTTLRLCFIAHPTREGHLTNERLRKEFEKQSEWKLKCKNAGLKSGEVRTAKTRGKRNKSGKVSSTVVELNPNIAFASAIAIASQGDSPPDPLATRFVRFWDSYPRQVAKAKAVDSFMKLAPDDALTDLIIAGVDRWKQSFDWTKDGGQFIPHPATFLNQKRWEEDPNPKGLPPVPHGGQRLPFDKGSQSIDFATRMALDAFGESP